MGGGSTRRAREHQLTAPVADVERLIPSAPPVVLQLAAHPLRWELLRALARGDRRVHELVALVREPQNVVSYHLAKLRDAHLVSSRRSSADRRDTYYSVDLARLRTSLSAAGAALHPALGGAPGGLEDVVQHRHRRPRVLFACTGNSARSQVAEALLVARSGGRVDASSAGSHPKPVHANAVRVVRDDHGIDLGDRRSKHLDELASERFDRVITLCDRVREVCPPFAGNPERIHWSIADPAAGHERADDEATYPAFRAMARELDVRIGFLLADLTRPDLTDDDPTRPVRPVPA